MFCFEGLSRVKSVLRRRFLDTLCFDLFFSRSNILLPSPPPLSPPPSFFFLLSLRLSTSVPLIVHPSLGHSPLIYLSSVPLRLIFCLFFSLMCCQQGPLVTGCRSSHHDNVSWSVVVEAFSCFGGRGGGGGVYGCCIICLLDLLFRSVERINITMSRQQAPLLSFSPPVRPLFCSHPPPLSYWYIIYYILKMPRCTDVWARVQHTINLV